MNPLENASRPVPPKAFTSILKGSSGHGAMSPTAKRKASNPSKSWTTPKAYRPPLASVTHTPSKKTARPGHGETTPSARSCRTPIPRPPTSPDPSKSWITSASSNPATPPSSPSKTTTPCGVGAHPAAGVATSYMPTRPSRPKYSTTSPWPAPPSRTPSPSMKTTSSGAGATTGVLHTRKNGISR